MTISDVLLILSALAGPIAAVQAQKWIERARELRARKLSIFHTLMATRALRAAAPEHVQALNTIDLIFSAKKRDEKPILDAWEEYLDPLNHYSENAPPQEVQDWNIKGEQLLLKMLQAMGRVLNYNFTMVQLKRGIYYPRGHADLITAQIALRDMIVKLFNGSWHLPLAIREFPVSDEAVKLQMDLQRALLDALTGKSATRITIEPSALGRPNC